MKKIILCLAACLFLALATYSQEISSNNVPVAVRKAFTRQFPGAAAVTYFSDNMDYRIEFLQQGKQIILIYNADGKLLETQKEISQAALPKEVAASAGKNFPGYTMMAIVKREAIDKGICFEMDLKKDNAGYSVRFSDKGEILDKVARTVEFKVSTKSKK